MKRGKPSKLFEKSHPDWIPNQSMGYEKKLADVTRHERANDRQLRLMHDVSNAIPKKELQVVVPCPIDFTDTILHSRLYDIDFVKLVSEVCENNLKDFSCQTEITNKYIVSMDKELTSLKSEICNLMSELSFLNVGTTEWVVSDEKRSKLSDFQHLLLTLMRLRLNLTLNDLAYHYNISSTTASSMFLKTIDVLYLRLKEHIIWPDREQLCKTTPMCFRKHFETRVGVIIDCFEVFIDKPKNALVRAQTFSYYKHHNTVKFLIGIAPQGVVSFISNSWGGRVSDKYLTENSGFLSKLLPGDVVMANRGFSIKDSVALYCAEVKVP
ncbi:uncharacterized protein LOC136086856 [Hydra vulgaris]|uniref:Uncharacterized protein LOC136086856 n=1 Tax=Hydra vulgaris TaxID=6087 RepID=A0ABM4CU04_HYDVU